MNCPKGDKEKFLVYGGQDEIVVTGYVDASFETHKDDFQSQSGYIFYLNERARRCRSAKQSTPMDYATEAELIWWFSVVIIVEPS